MSESLGIGRATVDAYYSFLSPQSVESYARVKLLPLEELAHHTIGRRIARDGASLGTKTEQKDYKPLEARLTAYVHKFSSAHSYGSVAHNEVADRFLSALHYIKELQEMFKTDEAKVKEIKAAVIRAFIEKLGDGTWRYIPKTEMSLFKEIMAEYERRRAAQTAVTPL